LVGEVHNVVEFLHKGQALLVLYYLLKITFLAAQDSAHAKDHFQVNC